MPVPETKFFSSCCEEGRNNAVFGELAVESMGARGTQNVGNRPAPTSEI